MPDTSTSIPNLVSRSFKDSLDKELIHLYDYESTSDVPLGSNSKAKQFIHVVPDLASKPAVPLNTPDLTKLTKKDPFEGPDYPKGEKIMELNSSDGANFALVHNKYALMQEHFMAIPHFDSERPFRPQTSGLIASDLELAHQVVQSYAAQNRDLICFFNGGPLAGASQPHLHMQFCPFQHDIPPVMQVIASSLDLSPGQVTKLPLPWITYCSKLPKEASSSTLESLYQSLILESQSYLSSLSNPSLLPPSGPKRDSHNLFLTSTHMFLTPRRSRLVAIKRVHSIDQGKNGLGGGWEDVEGSEKEMRLSVNGLSVIGYWYVGSKEEEGDLREYGLIKTLRECGYPNEEYEE